jgi:hypothetical protein
MSCSAVVRLATWTLAFIHTFPARKHLAAFLVAPSLDEGWKGLGALVAIALYLLPVRVQTRALVALWRNRQGVLRAAALLLVVVHAVPAVDHLPRLLHSGHWEDAWRGLGASLAMAWFLAPLSMQARAVGALARPGRVLHVALEARANLRGAAGRATQAPNHAPPASLGARADLSKAKDA